MTTKTFYLLGTAGTIFLDMQDGGTPPADATTGTGWTVGTVASGNYSSMAALSERVAATFGASALPDTTSTPNTLLADAWCIPAALTGGFLAGTWTLVFPVLAVSAAGGQDGRVRVRIWRALDQDLNGLAEITSSVLVSSAVTNLNTSTPQTCTITWNAPSVALNNEILIVQVAWEVTGAASDANADVLFRVGSGASITTPDFVAWTQHPYGFDGHLYIHSPATVLSAQVHASTLTSGKVADTTIYYGLYLKNITAGSISDVQSGMTVWLGSAAGLYDKGRARVRYTNVPGNIIWIWVAPNVFDGELALAENLYVTVKDEYLPWAIPPFFPRSGVSYAEAYDGSYTYAGTTYNQKPIANGGPAYAKFIDPSTNVITVSFPGASSFAAARRAVLGQYSADRATGGTASASSSTATHTADKAFDDNTATYWESTAVGVQTLTYLFAAAVKVRRVTLRCNGTTAPKLIFFKVSNDGSTWYDVGRAINQTGWGTPETRTFYPDVYNNEAFLYFRFSFEQDNGGATYRVYEVTISDEDRVTTSPYTWDVDDGTITVGTTTSEEITATFPAGFRFVHLTVTDTNGYGGVHHIPVLAAQAGMTGLISNFNILDHQIRPEGQSMEIAVYGSLPITTFPDNTLVLYWEDEYYNGVKGSLPLAGPSGREHMKFTGWIHSEVRRAENQEGVTLLGQNVRCLDIGGWLAELPSFPLVLLRKTLATPSMITECDGLNIDRFIYMFVRWLSTAAEIAPFTWSGTLEKYPVEILNAVGGTLYEQANGLARHIGYRFTCDKHGQLQVVVDPLLLPTADRPTTVHLSLTADDLNWFEYAHQRPSKLHWCQASGVFQGTQDHDDAGFAVSTYFALAPGEVPGQGPSAQDLGEQLVNSQADVNTRGGLLYARENAAEGQFTAQLAHVGDTGLDPADMAWITLTLGADRAPRGKTFSADRFLVNDITIDYDAEKHTKTVQIALEKETDGPDAVAYTP